ncbi:MAG: hypothetical protein ACRD0W_00870 [Acidimicrobiales bacterium]
MRLQIWPLPAVLGLSGLRLHCQVAHRFYIGEMRQGRIAIRAHAQMHTAQWAHPDTVPHVHLDVPTLQFGPRLTT